MAAGPATALSAVVLTAAEKQQGYSNNPTNGGPDIQGMLSGAIIDVLACQTKLAIIVAGMTAGSNKTAIQAQLTILAATS